MDKQLLEIVADDTQNIVLDSFQVNQKVNLPKWVQYLKVVAETPDDTIKAVFGMTGQRLKKFAQRVNLEHPDIELYFSELGETSQAMYRQVADILVSVEKTKNFNSVEAEFLAQDKDFTRIVRQLQQPLPRLLMSSEDRKTQRENKKQIKSIGLRNVIQGGNNAENCFYGKPDHFKRYARLSPWYHQELKDLNDRQNLFQSKSMTEMAHVYAKQTRELQESISDTLGFYRISPHEASIILARLHDFRWEDNGTISVPSKVFEKCPFWSESPQVEDKNDELKKTLILNTRFTPANINVHYFGYQPRLYPSFGLQLPIPNKTKKIIEQTESFVSLNGGPFFDYYWILVPSINLNNPIIQKQRDSWTLKEGDVNVVYNDYNEAALRLDQMLIESKCIIPIIIGERDGKCYFLSMFF
jgi:hypothetical protein